MKIIDNNPKTKFGMMKPSLSKIPGAALIYTALAFMDGAKKYDPYNWRENKVTASIYLDAATRHILAWQDGEQSSLDTNPPVPHLGHAMACLAILIDAYENGNLIDDRPKPGPSGRLIREFTASLSPSAAAEVIGVDPNIRKIKRAGKSK